MISSMVSRKTTAAIALNKVNKQMGDAIARLPRTDREMR